MAMELKPSQQFEDSILSFFSSSSAARITSTTAADNTSTKVKSDDGETS